MGNINLLRRDLAKEVAGTWFPFEAGIELKIARWGNERFLEAQRQAVERAKVVLNAKELTDQQRLEANKEAAAKTILVDWRNVEDDGVPVPYSSDQALAWFRDPEMSALWSFVFLKSVEEAHFRKECVESARKNSSMS